MDSRRLIVAFCVMLMAASASAQRWQEYMSEEDDFRMMAPGAFEIEVIDFESEYGIIVPARVYSYDDDTGSYSVTVVDYRDSQALHERRIEELDGVYISVYGEVDVRGSTAFAAKARRSRSAVLARNSSGCRSTDVRRCPARVALSPGRSAA